VSPRSRERGFTLLEVLVAFAIAALALTVLFRASGSGLAATQAAARYQEAVVRARSHLAALSRDAALPIGEAEGDDGGGFRWRLRVTPVATATPAAPGGGDRTDTAAPRQGQTAPAEAGGVPAATPGAPQPQSQRPGSPPLPTLFTVEIAIGWVADGRKREVVLSTARLSPLPARQGRSNEG
jgi:prepilin-type N-terminal cleavage/methylation domain-containing protein